MQIKLVHNIHFEEKKSLKDELHQPLKIQTVTSESPRKVTSESPRKKGNNKAGGTQPNGRSGRNLSRRNRQKPNESLESPILKTTKLKKHS